MILSSGYMIRLVGLLTFLASAVAMSAGAPMGHANPVTEPAAVDSLPSAAPLHAERSALSDLEVVGDIQPRQAPLGAELRWITHITHPPGSIAFAVPYTGGTLVVKERRIRVLKGGETEVALTLAGLDLGQIDVDPLALRYTDARGDDHPFQVLGGKIEIIAGADGSAEAADLSPPVAVEHWNFWLLGGLLAAMLATGGFVYWRRLHPPAPKPLHTGPQDTRTAAQVALDAIVALQTSGMLERREIKAFTYALDDILRTFLIRTQMRGELSQTTREFIESLSAVLIHERLMEVRHFFMQGDRVRFAGEEHEIEEARWLCESAIALINQMSTGWASASAGPAAGLAKNSPAKASSGPAARPDSPPDTASGNAAISPPRSPPGNNDDGTDDSGTRGGAQ
jgi:hypothetical protein